MRKATTTRPGPPRASTGVPGPPALGDAAPLKARRRTSLIALGVVMVVAGALVTAWLVASSGQSAQVLSVTKHVGRGERIGSDDLVSVEVAAAHGVETVPAASAGEVVGKVATVDLLPNTLLSPASYAEALELADGRSMVGVALDTSHRPTADLRSGDPVRFVQGPVANGETLGSAVAQIPAVVMSTSLDEVTGALIVNVEVDATDAATLAQLAASGRAVLVVDAFGTAPKAVRPSDDAETED